MAKPGAELSAESGAVAIGGINHGDWIAHERHERARKMGT
jgi:hypothetical protein